MHPSAVLFEREYERIRGEVYEGALPPFPGVELVDRHDLYGATNTRGRGRFRSLEAFLLSTHVRGPLLLETIRHETAHAAALLFQGDEGHGPAWQDHARLCGATGLTTLDFDHPLRQEP
ncbi:MAG: SprT-like domain-containing protein [Thermoplasmatota archaeon]